MRLGYAIVAVSDMDRSTAFYRDLLGLPVRFQSSHWTELDAGATTLALHAASSPDGAPTGHPAGTCWPGFSVEDLDAFHARMVKHGVVCTQEPKPLHGTKLANYVDPDGLPFSVGEHCA
ncbi:MAG: VOC family protein [Planctomycetota bacterium]|nr:VOC family protein [Planctomycetota bacterium]